MIMTIADRIVVQAAIRWFMGQDPDSTGPLHAAVANLMGSCPGCQTDHVCPGCGASVQHGDITCSGKALCPECLDGCGDDPRPWCDCLSGDGPGRHEGACKNSAHGPSACPNLPTPPVPPAPPAEHYWETATWRDVRRGDTVRLGQHTAEVETAGAYAEWVVRPHATTIPIRLKGRDKKLQLPPSGAVEIRRYPEEEAAEALLAAELGAMEVR